VKLVKTVRKKNATEEKKKSVKEGENHFRPRKMRYGVGGCNFYMKKGNQSLKEGTKRKASFVR